MKSSRVVIFGVTNFTRSNIPEILADFENMPTVDESALAHESRVKYLRNLEAVRLFVLEPQITVKRICESTGVHPNQLYRLLARVLQVDSSDGRILGKRALIPHRHYKEYVRTMAVQPRSVLTSSSAAGAMEQLLRKYPKILDWLNKAARNRTTKLRPGEIRAVRKPVRDLHGQWLAECSRHGVTLSEWPFNQDLRGFRTFQERLSKLESSARLENKQSSATQPIDATGSKTQKPEFWPAATRPFMVVQFDGHKIDIRLTLHEPDPYGLETIYEISRIWILVVTEIQTKVALGYYLALRSEYNKDDFAEALQAAIAPHRPVQLTIPGLKISDGGGYPTQLQPELAYHQWQFLQYDEAKSHLAQSSLTRVTETLGAWTISGRLGEPNDRSYEERFFGLFEASGFHQLPGSVGSNPNNPVKKLADVGKNLPAILSVDELEQLAYVFVANLNGRSNEGVGGRTPLQLMQYFTSKDSFLPTLLPVTRRHQLFLLKEAIMRMVSGGSTSPHINFEGVRYTSDVLQRQPELIGQVLRIYYMARDLRQVHAFFSDGTELGILTASRQWRTVPHSLRLRKEILRLIRLGKLNVDALDDPVEAYIRYKRKLAKDSKKAASSLARVLATRQAATADAAHGDSPFSTEKREDLPASLPAGLTSPPTRTQRTEQPLPVTVTKTLYFRVVK